MFCEFNQNSTILALEQVVRCDHKCPNTMSPLGRFSFYQHIDSFRCGGSCFSADFPIFSNHLQTTMGLRRLNINTSHQRHGENARKVKIHYIAHLIVDQCRSSMLSEILPAFKVLRSVSLSRSHNIVKITFDNTFLQLYTR